MYLEGHLELFQLEIDLDLYLFHDHVHVQDLDLDQALLQKNLMNKIQSNY